MAAEAGDGAEGGAGSGLKDLLTRIRLEVGKLRETVERLEGEKEELKSSLAAMAAEDERRAQVARGTENFKLSNIIGF